MKTRFSSDQKQRFIFDNIIDIFEQMCQDLQNVTRSSNSSDYLIELLFQIKPIIVRLNTIYDIAEENYFIMSSPQQFLTNDDIEKLKLKFTQLQFDLHQTDKQSSTIGL